MLCSIVTDVGAAQVPGWILSGSNPEAFEVGTRTAEDGDRIAFLKSVGDEPDGFGTLMQTIPADGHREQRIRMSGSIKSADVVNWAGMWMRIEGFGGEPLEFDNMGDRPITGSTDWQRYEIVLDIPGEAVTISFGVLLFGGGEIQLANLRFDEVGDSVPITGGMAPLPSDSANSNPGRDAGRQ